MCSSCKQISTAKSFLPFYRATLWSRVCSAWLDRVHSAASRAPIFWREIKVTDYNRCNTFTWPTTSWDSVPFSFTCQCSWSSWVWPLCFSPAGGSKSPACRAGRIGGRCRRHRPDRPVPCRRRCALIRGASGYPAAITVRKCLVNFEIPDKSHFYLFLFYKWWWKGGKAKKKKQMRQKMGYLCFFRGFREAQVQDAVSTIFPKREEFDVG